MAVELAVSMGLIGVAFGSLLMAWLLKGEMEWIEPLRILFIGGAGISFVVALGYAEGLLTGTAQTIVGWLTAFLSMALLILVFISGITWVIGIFNGMAIKRKEQKEGAY